MTATSTFSVALANETATSELMADLALLIGAGDVITLSGDLGAGKTAAARALIRYLAADDTLEVPSPTFTLAQSYELPSFPLVHADLYRINDASELEEIGLSPLPDDIVALIEWPERAPDAMPADRIDIAFSHRPALGSAARAAEITGYGQAAAKVARLHELRRFLERAGFLNARRERMPGDASTRSYARLRNDDGSVILMNSPRVPTVRRSTTAGPTARRCISPKTSGRSSRSETACASTASPRRRSGTPISNPASSSPRISARRA